MNNINNNRINYIKKIIKNFFSEYINNLNSKNLNKNDLLYIYFTFFNFEYTNDLTKINEKFKKKDFDELKHKFKKIKFNEIGKKIILSKFETIVDKCGYNNGIIDNGGFYWFNSVDADNYYFWDADNRSVGVTDSKYEIGKRVIIKLSTSLVVESGDGTVDDPYVVVKGKRSC